MYVDGERTVTLKGDTIAAEFQAIVEDYVKRSYRCGVATPRRMNPMSNEKIQAVRGMNDCLPADEPLWRRLEEASSATGAPYGYREMRTPILEQTRLFKRAIGEVTDIVEKEMYTFVDELNGESLTLRPEGTAGVVRAVIEHNLLYDGRKRLWYMGPMFRHERPQKGRYRQFHQVGVEALGFSGPDVDAELIVMCQRLWDDLGLHGVAWRSTRSGRAPSGARTATR